MLPHMSEQTETIVFDPIVDQIAHGIVVNDKAVEKSRVPDDLMKTHERELKARAERDPKNAAVFLHLVLAGTRLHKHGLDVAAQQLFSLAHIGLSASEVAAARDPSNDGLRAAGKGITAKRTEQAKVDKPMAGGVGMRGQSKKGKKS